MFSVNIQFINRMEQRSTSLLFPSLICARELKSLALQSYSRFREIPLSIQTISLKYMWKETAERLLHFSGAWKSFMLGKTIRVNSGIGTRSNGCLTYVWLATQKTETRKKFKILVSVLSIISRKFIYITFHRMQAFLAWYHSIIGWYHMRTESTFLRIDCRNSLGIFIRFAGIQSRIVGTRIPEYSLPSTRSVILLWFNETRLSYLFKNFV